MARSRSSESLASAGVAFESAASMSDAVGRSRALAEPGDVILLAPACSSYDMYLSYAHRGEAFQTAVRALASGGEA